MRPRIFAAASTRSLHLLACGRPASFRLKRHVLEHGHVRVERVVLEHHRDVALLRRDVVDHAAADRDLAVGDLLQPGDHAQQRRLAAARRADQHAELAVVDLDVDAVHDLGWCRRIFLTRDRVTEAMVFSSGLCGDRQAGRADRLERLVGEDELLVAERLRLRRRAARDARARASKISRPTSSSVARPSRMRPASTSMSSSSLR